MFWVCYKTNVVKIETTHCSNSCTQQTTPKPKLIAEINKLMEPQHQSDQIDYFTHVVEIAKKTNPDDEEFVWKELYDDDEKELSVNFYTPSPQDESIKNLEPSSLKC